MSKLPDDNTRRILKAVELHLPDVYHRFEVATSRHRDSLKRLHEAGRRLETSIKARHYQRAVGSEERSAHEQLAATHLKASEVAAEAKSAAAASQHFAIDEVLARLRTGEWIGRARFASSSPPEQIPTTFWFNASASDSRVVLQPGVSLTGLEINVCEPKAKLRVLLEARLSADHGPPPFAVLLAPRGVKTEARRLHQREPLLGKPSSIERTLRLIKAGDKQG